MSDTQPDSGQEPVALVTQEASATTPTNEALYAAGKAMLIDSVSVAESFASP